MKTIIEPFRIKSVEPIRWTTRAHREAPGAPPKLLLLGWGFLMVRSKIPTLGNTGQG